MAHVADHLSVSALEQRYRSCTDATAARHVQAIWLLAKGHHIAEVSATVAYARRWVERLLARRHRISDPGRPWKLLMAEALSLAWFEARTAKNARDAGLAA